jgi:DNA-binding transcriptional LysR family regulator
VENKKLKVKEVLEDQLVIITPVNHPLTKKSQLKANDLNGQFIIMHEQDSAPRRVIEDYVRKHNISVNIPLEMSSNRAIKRAVAEGIGIALISRKVANEQIQAKRLKAIPLSDPSMNRKFYMVHHKDKYISESLQSFIDMVFEWADAYAQDLP